MTESPVLESEVLERLRDWGGRDLVPRLIDLFLEEGPRRMVEIRAGLESGDMPGVEKAAHSMKSGAANLGASRLRFRAAELEEVAARGDPALVADLVGRVEQDLEATIERLRSVRNSEEAE